MTTEELIEALAVKEHESWARWMAYFLDKLETNGQGRLVIAPSYEEALRRQVAIPFAQLYEHEKQYDRDEVAHILPIIEQYARQAREAALDEVQEFVVRHCFDTTSGRRIDDFITGLLERANTHDTP